MEVTPPSSTTNVVTLEELLGLDINEILDRKLPLSKEYSMVPSEYLGGSLSPPLFAGVSDTQEKEVDYICETINKTLGGNTCKSGTLFATTLHLFESLLSLFKLNHGTKTVFVLPKESLPNEGLHSPLSTLFLTVRPSNFNILCLKDRKTIHTIKNQKPPTLVVFGDTKEDFREIKNVLSLCGVKEEEDDVDGYQKKCFLFLNIKCIVSQNNETESETLGELISLNSTLTELGIPKQNVIYYLDKKSILGVSGCLALGHHQMINMFKFSVKGSTFSAQNPPKNSRMSLWLSLRRNTEK